MQSSETIASIDSHTATPQAVKADGRTPSAPGVFCLREVGDVFGANFFDRDVCRQWVINRLHASGTNCPECGAAIPEKFHDRFWSGERIKCGCGKFFTALTGTFLSGCSLDFREVILLAVLLYLGVGNKQIAEFLKMTPESIRLWRQKFEAFDAIEKLNT